MEPQGIAANHHNSICKRNPHVPKKHRNSEISCQPKAVINEAKSVPIFIVFACLPNYFGKEEVTKVGNKIQNPNVESAFEIYYFSNRKLRALQVAIASVS